MTPRYDSLEVAEEPVITRRGMQRRDVFNGSVMMGVEIRDEVRQVVPCGIQLGSLSIFGYDP